MGNVEEMCRPAHSLEKISVKLAVIDKENRPITR
jgi:hypothetical protein